MEGQFEFLIEKNEYVTKDAPDFVKNAWKKARQKKRIYGETESCI